MVDHLHPPLVLFLQRKTEDYLLPQPAAAATDAVPLALVLLKVSPELLPEGDGSSFRFFGMAALSI